MQVAYLLKRIGSALVTIFLVFSFDFYLFRILPGDPFALLFRGVNLTPEQMKNLRAQFGLDQSLWVQYLVYLRNTVSGNFGISYQTRVPVSELVFPALMNTVILLLSATAIAICAGIMIGMIAAWRRGTKVEIAMSGTTLVLYCMPTFWLGLMLMVIGVIYLGLPVSGMSSVMVQPGILSHSVDLLRHMALPLATLVLGLTGQYVLVMKGALLNVLTEDYMVTARAKGISKRKLMWDHGFRNAILPMVTLMALNIGLSFGGAIQTETIFSWPGIGILIYNAILARDYPVLQGCFLVIAVAVIFANLIADLIYPLVDPRVTT
jgi:peptide/nickel transport system permease protein